MIPCLAPLRGGRACFNSEPGPLDSACWVWQGCLNSKGYAVRGTKEGRYLVHRRAFEQANGVEIASDVETHHRCKTRACVNPAHIEALAAPEHRDEHRDGLTLAERAVAEIRHHGRAKLSLLALDLGTTPDALRMSLRRLGPGVLERVAPDTYALHASEARL